MKKYVLLIVFAFTVLITHSQVTYQLGNTDYFNIVGSGGGGFSNNGNELGMWANFGDKKVVAFREFKTNGDNSGDSRSLQVGDVFTVQVYASSARGEIGFSLLSSPTSTSSYNDRHNNNRLYIEVDDNYNSWYVNNGSNNPSLNYNVSGTTYRDYMFKIYITSETTCDVELYVNNSGSVSGYAKNVTMNGSAGDDISHFALYLHDDYNDFSNSNIFWKQTTNHNASGTVKLGQDLSSGTNFNPGLITDGLASDSNSALNANSVEIYGNSGSSVIFDQANTYTGTTTIKNNATLNLSDNLINSDITVEYGGTLTVSGDNVRVQSLTVEDGGTAQINSGKGLNVINDLVVNNGGDLALNSDSQNYASIIVGGSSTGDITYYRYVNSEGEDQWDLIGSPVDGLAISTFVSDNDGVIATNGSLSAVGIYDNSNNSWANYGLGAAWESNNFEMGRGYQMATASGGTMAFTGSVVNSNQAFSVVNLHDNGGRRWNLVSNPYPSYLDLSSFLSENVTNNAIMDQNLYGAVYGWNPNKSGGAGYDSYDGNEAVYIAPGQGFMIAAESSSAANLSFTTAMQTVSGGDDFVVGDVMENTEIYLRLYNNDAFIEQTHIRFRENMTLGIDQTYDVGNYYQGAEIASRLVEGDEGVSLEHQNLPLSAMENAVIPLVINQAAGQEFRINLHTATIPDPNVYLEDVEEGTFTNLYEGDFVLTPTSDLEGAGRFFIHMSADTMSNGELSTSILNAYKEIDASYITIEGLATQSNETKVSLYNILGREVLSTTLNNNMGTQTITTVGLSAGIYVIELESGSDRLTKKLLIQ